PRRRAYGPLRRHLGRGKPYKQCCHAALPRTRPLLLNAALPGLQPAPSPGLAAIDTARLRYPCRPLTSMAASLTRSSGDNPSSAAARAFKGSACSGFASVVQAAVQAPEGISSSPLLITLASGTPLLDTLGHRRRRF